MLSSAVFKAIAHPVRRDVLRRLRAGPLSAGELAQGQSISKPSLSAHFKILREADLIYARREGNHIYYVLNVSVADELLAMTMDLFRVDPDAAAEPSTEDGAHVPES